MVFSKSTLAQAVLAMLAMVAATSLLCLVDAEEQVILNGEEQLITFTDGLKDIAKGCCDSCLCTRSLPPKCQCTDQKKQCHPRCKKCRCTRSWPPICRCMDIDNFCYPQCSASPPSPSPPSSSCNTDCKVCRCTRSFPPICSCADV